MLRTPSIAQTHRLEVSSIFRKKMLALLLADIIDFVPSTYLDFLLGFEWELRIWKTLYVKQNHSHLVRHFWGSMAEMENCSICKLCEKDPENVACDHDIDQAYDFAVICPACPPWSKLGQTVAVATPDQHKEFNCCFGDSGSAVTVVKKRRPLNVLFEEVPQFATVRDSTGRTGLERLSDDLFAIKDDKRRRVYVAYAYVKLGTTNWGGETPSRERCAYYMQTRWISRNIPGRLHKKKRVDDSTSSLD